MESEEQARVWAEFLEKNYHAELLEKVRKGELWLVVDFSLLAKHNPDLADSLLDKPEDTLQAAEAALEQFDLPERRKDFTIRIKNLPKSNTILIREIRSTHIGKLISVEGIVRQKSEVRPMITTARFECPSCGNKITVIQTDIKFKEPSRCSCGRKGKFKLAEKELVDAQALVLEELPEQLDDPSQPKRINIFLKKDLVSPMSNRRTNPGARIHVVGIVKEVPIFLKTGGQSTKFDLFIEGNNIEPLDKDYSEISISEEDKKAIYELSKDPFLLKKMVDSIAPSIYGHEKIKEALVLQLVGGVRKVRKDGVVTRGDSHILLVGDPGSAKSQLLKRIEVVAPKGKYVTGKGATGAGLTAAVVKDEFIQGWALEGGALVLANKGICLIDELDKMSKEDSWAMHEALEQQTITISKANIQATLKAETTVLAAANPKFGRFDPYETIAEQINLPPTLLNRFDLIFPIKDVPDPSKDERMARFILQLHKDSAAENPPIPTELLRKYISFARQNFFPKLTEGAMEEIKEYYLKMRTSGSKEGVVNVVPISARQLEALVRLSEASARLRLSDKVLRKDAKKAIELLDYCLREVALDVETGTIDIDRLGEMPASQRSKIVIIREILADLENKLGKTIPIDDIFKQASLKGIAISDAEEAIQKLKRAGDVYEPKPGFLSLI
ncbi:MAG: minichromosome maintenance protein MCM [Candidatus Woesearchaeota archaeon]